MDDDITPILEAWKFDPERVNVRFIEALDGRPLIQVRIELGILQMNRDGRPDGGPDVLENLEAAIAADDGLKIDSEMATALREEAVLIHQRYVALLSLEVLGVEAFSARPRRCGPARTQAPSGSHSTVSCQLAQACNRYCAVCE